MHLCQPGKCIVTLMHVLGAQHQSHAVQPSLALTDGLNRTAALCCC